MMDRNSAATSPPPQSHGDLRTALSAFAHRAVRPRHAVQLVLYSGGIALLLVLVAAWIVGEAREQILYPGQVPLPWDTLALADIFALILLSLGLFVLAPAAVAASLAGERRAGTLDQLRTTPAPPLGLLLGMIVGAPLRLYLLCAGPLALHVVAAFTGRVPLSVLVGSLLVLVAGAALAVLFGAVLALAPQRDSGGALLAVAAAGLSGFAGILTTGMGTGSSSARWAFLHPGGALSSLMLSFDGLWQRMMLSQWRLDQLHHDAAYNAALALAPAASVALSIVLGALLAHAACRKLASPERPLFGKVSAVAVFSVDAAAIILPVAQRDVYSARSATSVTLALGIILLPVFAMLTVFSTPTPEAYALAVRRGLKRGPFSDGAGPQAAAWGMLAIFFALCTASFGALGYMANANGRDFVAVVWSVALAATLPLFVLFGTLRFQTAGARAAFHAAIGAHVIFQMIGIAIARERSHGSVDLSVVEVAAVLGVVVPLVVIVLLSQRVSALRLSAKKA
jgi:hypothetical protein